MCFGNSTVLGQCRFNMSNHEHFLLSSPARGQSGTDLSGPSKRNCLLLVYSVTTYIEHALYYDSSIYLYELLTEPKMKLFYASTSEDCLTPYGRFTTDVY